MINHKYNYLNRYRSFSVNEDEEDFIEFDEDEDDEEDDDGDYHYHYDDDEQEEVVIDAQVRYEIVGLKHEHMDIINAQPDIPSRLRMIKKLGGKLVPRVISTKKPNK